MKIKGPGNYSGLPAPSEEVKGKEPKGSVPFSTETAGVQGAESARKSAPAGKTSAFEASLQQIAKAVRKEGVSGEAAINGVVDSVLEQMLGKEFLGKPEASSLKAAVVPVLSQDENFMSKLNGVLARLHKS